MSGAITRERFASSGIARRQFAQADTPGPEPWINTTGGPLPTSCTLVRMPAASTEAAISGLLIVDPSCRCCSGVDLDERGHQVARVIEDAAAQLLLAPRRHRPIALGQVAQAREGLVAIAAGVEEVDRLAARDAVARRRHVETGLRLGHHVGGLQH